MPTEATFFQVFGHRSNVHAAGVSRIIDEILFGPMNVITKRLPNKKVPIRLSTFFLAKNVSGVHSFDRLRAY